MIVLCLLPRHGSCRGYLILALLAEGFSMGMSLREHLAILPDRFERRLRLILKLSGAGYGCMLSTRGGSLNAHNVPVYRGTRPACRTPSVQ